MNTKLRDVLEPKEMKGILSVVALNKLWPKKEIHLKKEIKGWTFSFRWRAKSNLWGRFGGGWNWELGFQASSRTIIFMLLICTVRISRP